MGCGSSKSAIAPQQTIWKSPQDRERSTSRPNSSQSGLMCQNGSEKEAHHHATITVVQEATEDTEKATESTRIISASSTDSKFSIHTNDSGVGDDYAQMIPERPAATEEKETATIPVEIKAPNSTIDGTPAPVGHSLPAGHRSHPLPPIQTSANDAKISSSPSTTSPYGWAAFEIIMAERPEGSVNRKRKPLGVRRLERRREEITSKEELLEKQRVAEQRRKELEQQMLDKIRARHEREQQMKQAMEKFMAMQSQKTETKMASTQENREAYFRGLRDHLQEKDVRGAKKKLAPVKPPRPQRFNSSEDTTVNLGAN